ncbi:histidine kinase [Flavobacterium magnum]|uniref:Histidine kinase n=1 Tax=Flavobacterium magnum TaxID=2162713 RepID=A0A2S0RCW8_9FLAO|nr:PAS domain-containing protein [Flavobacterium magnum]AWA29455.1 histidine kinase [Flavobacterium magnum]
MKELRTYDESIARFGASQRTVRPLLLSWDLFSMHLQKVFGNTADVRQLASMAQQHHWNFNFETVRDLSYDTVIVVTDAQVNIVFATQNVTGMTGYEPSEMIGKSPKMFQGQATSKTTTKTIRSAISNAQPFETTVVNYRKDGTPYDCAIRSYPIFDVKGRLSHFIAFENAA